MNTNKYQQKKIIETQKVLIDFLNKLFVTKQTRLIDNIKRPSGDGGAWFFAVDNKSRKTKRGGEMDPTIHGFRKALEQVVINDQRKVRGLWSFAVSKGRRIDTFPWLPQVWVAA